ARLIRRRAVLALDLTVAVGVRTRRRRAIEVGLQAVRPDAEVRAAGRACGHARRVALAAMDQAQVARVPLLSAELGPQAQLRELVAPLLGLIQRLVHEAAAGTRLP